ncbi:type II toxin-antitoxin system RelE/ParE family toxin [Methylobacterium sp. NMS14P]|uniref:type II toxin-antitoxin system RelE/ParE family toxin n=1 Tax=Methylobacterium sp. NMS14P TaxID=2894310 RepID=UPI0023596892|nr:type II toxin-antitoxin system RelE/ParE family toxin [Methylobacterium sp. NMS14P]WCS26885.1 type II toxin-antitoxin system RelE/ParE family toxin [Methylobacterium sp. NMS14P]
MLTYIAQRNPHGARRVQKRLQALMDLLLQPPLRGFDDGPGRHQARRGTSLSLCHHRSRCG